MTEEEAKTKWCPFIRTVALAPFENIGGSTVQIIRTNRDDNAQPGADRCIASACMAWRRERVMIDRATLEVAVPGVTPFGQLEERYGAGGFCGLAGTL